MNLVPYVIVGAVLLINVLLWIFWMPRYVDRRISRFQNELVDRHYAEVETMYRKMRGWRHDYHNHIQVLKAHMELGDYGDALRYLDMLNDDLATVDTVIKTGNVMVDAILNSKLTIIREKGIQVDATAVVPGQCPGGLPADGGRGGAVHPDLYRHREKAALYRGHEFHEREGQEERTAISHHQVRGACGGARLRSRPH